MSPWWTCPRPTLESWTESSGRLRASPSRATSCCSRLLPPRWTCSPTTGPAATPSRRRSGGTSRHTGGWSERDDRRREDVGEGLDPVLGHVLDVPVPPRHRQARVAPYDVLPHPRRHLDARRLSPDYGVLGLQRRGPAGRRGLLHRVRAPAPLRGAGCGRRRLRQSTRRAVVEAAR